MADMFPSSNNAYVPAFDMQAKLIVNYSRDWKKNKVNQIMTVTPVDKQIGKYLKMKPEAQGNVKANYAAAHKWPDGAPRPVFYDSAQRFDFLEYFCERYTETFPIGYQLEEQAVWDVVQSQSNILANRMQLQRAIECYTVLTTSGNYSNTDTATNYGGGKWDVATSTNRFIQKTLMRGVELIAQSTMNSVGPEDLVLVMSPQVARKAAASGEIADYLGQSVYAPEFLKMDLWKDQLSNYGMPPELYGIKVIVDPLVKDVANLNATTSKSFVAGTTSAYLVARPGAVSGNNGGSSFSFVHCFTWKPEEFAVEVLDDPYNKRKLLSVLDNRHVRSVAPEAGVLFTAVVD